MVDILNFLLNSDRRKNCLDLVQAWHEVLKIDNVTKNRRALSVPEAETPRAREGGEGQDRGGAKPGRRRGVVGAGPLLKLGLSLPSRGVSGAWPGRPGGGVRRGLFAQV